MKKLMMIAVIGAGALLLAGCYSLAQQTAYVNAAVKDNSGHKYSLHGADQHGQAAHCSTDTKAIHINKLGIDFKRGNDNIAYINGKPASNDEDNADASVYRVGLVQVIVYKKTGKINAMENGKYLGRLK